MAEKRGKSFSHYGNGGQPNSKRQRPNDSYSYGSSSSPNPFPGSRQNGVASSFSSLYSSSPNKKQAKEQAEQLLNQLSRLPDPERCEPCNLAGEEMQIGLIALLDKLVAEEVVTGDEDIIHHARELQRLLSTRAAKTHPSKTRNLDAKRPATKRDAPIPTYIANKMRLSKDMPPLPPISEPHYAEAVFTHRSITYQAQSKGLDTGDNYERLEFLGDAYIEVIASRILYSRFPQLDVPQQSQLRESLVKNETLGRFAAAYCFGDRLVHGGHMDKGKAWDKICADVFEAYVAAIVLSSPEGFSTAEAWLTELWAPQLFEFKERMIENPKAREDLQRLVVGKGIKLNFKEERAMETINGVQNYHIGVYLTGWGFEDEWLGSGQGQNKAQASVEAAQDAIGRSDEVGVIPVANKKKLEMYPPKLKQEEPKKENPAVVEGGDSINKADGGRDSSASTEKKKKKEKKQVDVPCDS